jgi:hypothetical protein
MDELKFRMKITAIGEVRDKDGNLLSAEPVEAEIDVSESDLRDMGLTEEQITDLRKEGQTL